MISNFSDAEYLMKRPPHPRERFFEQTVFDQDLSQGFLELARLSLELLDLVRGRLTRRVAGEPFLARLQELLRPTVVQVLIDPFLAAELSNAVLATQAFQHDTDFLFSGMMPACGSANIPDCLFSALRYALARLSHRCSSAGYDEPAILSYAISSFCPTSADGLQKKEHQHEVLHRHPRQKQRQLPGAGTHRRTVLRAIRGARGGCEGPRRVRSRRTRESKGREGILLHVWPRRGIHPQGTCSDQFAVRLNYRGQRCDRRGHAHPATSESADAQGGLTQLRTGGVR